MANLVSPGVLVTETDLTTIVPSLSTTTGAICGTFESGPCMVPVLVTSEAQLVQIFGKPSNTNYTSFFTAANFLAYSNRLYVVRAINANANNATNDSTSNVQILNDDDWFTNYLYSDTYSTIKFAAKTPGAKFNDLEISICSDKNKFKSTRNLGKDVNGFETGTRITANTVANSNTVSFNCDVSAVLDANEMQLVFTYSPDKIITKKVTSTSTNTAVILDTTDIQTANDVLVSCEWIYASEFDKPIGTSTYVKNNSGKYDEMHIIVRDTTGKLSGKQYTILETFNNVSKASDAKNEDGTPNYYVEVLKNQSQYIYAINHINAAWGVPASNTTFVNSVNTTYQFYNGTNVDSTAAELVSGYQKFADKEQIDFSLLLTGDGEGFQTVINYAMEISNSRKDCMTFVSPNTIASCLPGKAKTTSSVTNDIVEYRKDLTAPSSYCVMDSGWKYQFDKYWNTYRYIPLNGDIAGLVAQTELDKDAWWSPAGFNRGRIKNAVKLSWNPDQGQRDELYSNGINPVVSFPNEGPILYGDKTLQEKSSAFDRINVRRLFIVLEKAIARAAKYSLFEFNDEFTRAQFVALVDPYLRDVKARRGIYDYRVVCDTTNNTPQVIDSNRFIGSIFIKPARSINFIELNFVAVGTGVDFSTITDSAGL